MALTVVESVWRLQALSLGGAHNGVVFVVRSPQLCALELFWKPLPAAVSWHLSRRPPPTPPEAPPQTPKLSLSHTDTGHRRLCEISTKNVRNGLPG